MKYLLLIALLFTTPVFAAYDCDGTDAWIDTNWNNNIDTNTDLSVSLWINPDTLPSDERLIFGEIGPTDFRPRFELAFITSSCGTDGEIRFKTVDDAGGSVNNCSTSAVSADEWTHLAATFDESGNSVVYFNGTAVGTQSVASSSGTYSFSDAPLAVCARSTSATTAALFYDGQVDEVAFWTTNLTPAEVNQLAKGRVRGLPLQIQPSSLQFYMPLDETADGSSGDGATIIDRTGTENGDGNGGLTGNAGEVLTY